MLDEISFPQGFNATPEIVELTQPPEVRKLLIAEIAQMKAEAMAMNNLKPSHNLTAYGIAFGPLAGALIAVGSGGNIPMGGAEGMLVGLSAGSAIDYIVGSGYDRATNKIKDVRQQNFSKRVWSALPPDRQQTIKASLPQVKK